MSIPQIREDAGVELGADGLSIIAPHPQAMTKMARQQGYVVAKVEPAYRLEAPMIVAAINDWVGFGVDADID